MLNVDQASAYTTMLQNLVTHDKKRRAALTRLQADLHNARTARLLANDSALYWLLYEADSAIGLARSYMSMEITRNQASIKKERGC
jgi:hypothetical protein